MGEIGAEDLVNWEKLQSNGDVSEEKILVLVRLRPLSEKEIARNEVADWECINSTTILYRNSLQERSGLPTAYSFDRVFRGDSQTREVYDEGIKEIALSVVDGVNSTVFAYGQTSSGKTYTMNGITEYTVTDIYEYVQRHEERAFVMKFSAMEIYNEVVRDLLSTENTPLRMLDDPERGTIIEKLTEETLRDWNHLKELLSICEAQRQVGETSLNEASSRSHQILRLTIESTAREFIGKGNSTTLAASVNFVDLAGSERASQALSVGQRLKEGCHINRSLLTLSTVIRKLSKGRNGHINYRDSKLTRILQPALGGNARTAIICTLSPSRSHVEQSRNTLLFASCAKKISTSAQVNGGMSQKALGKHLPKKVARVENEFKSTPGPPVWDHGAFFKKKDAPIEKLEKEISELKKQRDLAHSRIDDLLRAIETDKASSQKDDEIIHSESSYSSDDISDLSHKTEDLHLGFGQDTDEICKEVRCVEMDKSDGTNESFGQSTSESEESMPILSESINSPVLEQHALSDLRTQATVNCNYGELNQKIQDVEKTIDSLFKQNPNASTSPRAPSASTEASGSFKLTRSQSCGRANVMTALSEFEMSEQLQSESTPPTALEKNFARKQWKLPPVIYGTDIARLARNDSRSSDYSSFVDEIRDQNYSHEEEDIPTLGSFVTGLREMAKIQYENRTGHQIQEIEKRDENIAGDQMMNDWPLKFEKLQKSIIELWQTCNISLIHRTYFILLIKDGVKDSIYVEVEHRRLSFLKEIFSTGTSVVQDGRTLTLASSKKSLRREREMLSRLMYKRYTEDERNRIYKEWGINLNSKQRRLQLVHLLWTDTEKTDHITKSAAIVAKLIGFSHNGRALKEMLGLSFTPPRVVRRSLITWKKTA
ncbi:hypothetical protein MIMGU_mgv1a001117mg [Erythranthe guttata]|uniref:Kinesin-like protein n=1 Tax=Erythranthe guttata TaxID=4155 RepID=A0A022RIY4_ERYGU|nr:hypothetical protein MIMGU_mgv1a001117mg [Erythranthe guttata]